MSWLTGAACSTWTWMKGCLTCLWLHQNHTRCQHLGYTLNGLVRSTALQCKLVYV